MLKSLFGLILAAMVLSAGAAKDDQWKPTPIMRTVTPDEAKSGDKLTITGENLGKALVAEVFLTAGEDTFKLDVVSQNETTIVAKIGKAKQGRLRLMVLTAGASQQYLEQPIVVEIR